MDTRKQKLSRNVCQNNIGEAKDRIIELPDSLIHHILSFLEIKNVVRTSVLSKRWIHIWASIPTLDFPYRYEYPLSKINTFMDFVDRTFHLHDASSIQKFHLKTNEHMSASRVHSWIENLTRRNVKELTLYLDHSKTYFIPLSLFTCESLTKLELHANDDTRLPRNFCFPKLKSLKLYEIRFTDDCWNEYQFSNCPILEDLILGDCTWVDVRNFCISIPTLKHLEIYNLIEADTLRVADVGLGNCAFKINAPTLVSLIYFASVAKEYIVSSFQTLQSAEIILYEYGGVLREQQIGYGAAVSKFFRALSHVQCLEIYPVTLKTLSTVDNFENTLPRVFQDVYQLILKEGLGETSDKSLFILLKAVPNLRWLVFEEDWLGDNKEVHSWASRMLTAGCMFQHLQSVTIVRFNGNKRQMRWFKLIVETAKALSVITLCVRSGDAINNEELMSEFLNIHVASETCELQFEKY